MKYEKYWWTIESHCARAGRGIYIKEKGYEIGRVYVVGINVETSSRYNYNILYTCMIFSKYKWNILKEN